MIEAASARKMESCQNLILFAVRALESLVLPLVGEAVEGDFLIEHDLLSLRHRSWSSILKLAASWGAGASHRQSRLLKCRSLHLSHSLSSTDEITDQEFYRVLL